MARFRVFAALAALVCCQAAGAQTPTGGVQGAALDPSGQAVPNAAVQAADLNTARKFEAIADGRGAFAFPVLPAGEYEITAAADGLIGVPRRVRVEVGRSLRVDLRLELEGQATTIEVIDSTPLVDVGSAAVGWSIPREQIADLPLNERDFLRLGLLAGGAHPAAPGSELSRQNDSGIHLNGARESANNFLLDGVDNNDLFINRLVVNPPLDSVREFRLQSANYSAEFGRSGGAQINVVSRSGSNDLHGSLYDYLRNDALDARNFFDPRNEPKYRRNQFGAALGGPIQNDRTFFFAAYEGTRIKDSVSRTARVPTAAEKTGDFSANPDPIIDIFTQQPFPNNVIPAERLDPIGLGLAQYWPDPNRSDPNANLVASPSGDSLANKVYGRLDHYWTRNNSSYVRFNRDYDRTLEPFSDNNTNVPGFGNFILDRAINLVVADTHLFGPSVVLESRFGFNRLKRDVLQQNFGNDIGGGLGIPAMPSSGLNAGFPAVTVAGYDGLADDTSLPIYRTDKTYHLVEHLSWVRGRHSVKTGGEYRRFSADGFQGLFGRGQFNFLGVFSQNAVSDLLLGLPTYTLQTVVDNPFALRAASLAGYLQDDWRIRPNLTLNFGLRYEWNRPAVDAEDRFSLFDLERNELVQPPTERFGRAGYAGDLNNFAPRIGLSWSPAGAQDDLVVRAGYGVFHNLAIQEITIGLYFNPPFFDLRVFQPSETQLLTLSNPFPAEAGFAPPPSVNTVQPDFRTAYVQHWNAGLEKRLPGGTVFRASYIGTKGTKLLRRRDLNQPAPGEGYVDSRRPIPGYANVVMFESAASSIYHSGVFSLERRLRQGLTFSAAYTLSKSIDDASAFLDSDGDIGFPQNSRDFAAERALSSFDQRRRLVVMASYRTSFRSVLARNWELYLIGVAQSGRPLTPALTFDNSNTGNAGGIFGEDRPDRIADPNNGPGTAEQFFNTGAFVNPPPLSFGNAGRNVISGPGQASLDLAVARAFSFGERARVTLRAEAFNIANRANFDLPRRYADQPTFGRINSAQPARQLQLSLRVAF